MKISQQSFLMLMAMGTLIFMWFQEEMKKKSKMLYYRDRFYENTGKGKFLKASDAIPDIRMSGSCVTAADFDNDGDLDLFVGGKTVPGKYPLPASSVLLKNESREGKIKFVDVTKDLAPFMTDLGMVSDAEWVDIDNDDTLDLLIVGEWMPIKVIKNAGDKFVDLTPKSGLENQIGWWFSIATGDFDKDGDMDFIVGNLGKIINTKRRKKNNSRYSQKILIVMAALILCSAITKKERSFP